VALQAEAAGRKASESDDSKDLVRIEIPRTELRVDALRIYGASSISKERFVKTSPPLFGQDLVEVSPPDASPGFWGRLGAGISNFVAAAGDFSKGILKGLYQVAKFVVADALPMLVTGEFWRKVGSGLLWIGKKILDPATWVAAAELAWIGIKSIAKGLVHAVTHPFDSLKRVGSFLKQMCDDFGITDICVGIDKLLQGDRGGAWQAFKGAGTAFCQATGLADAYGALESLGRALYCLGTGDRAGAALHLLKAGGHALAAATSFGTIAAVFATGGAAAGAVVGLMLFRTSLKTAAKQVLKTATKEFFQEAGEQIGKELVTNVSKTLTKDVLLDAGQQMARQGVSELAREHLGKEAAKLLLDVATAPEVRAKLARELLEKAGPEAFEKVMEKSGSTFGSKLMKKADVTEEVAKLTEKFLKDAAGRSQEDIAREFLEKGLAQTEKEALELAKETKRVLGGAGRRADRELAESLSDGVMNPLREHINAGVREGYEREMRELLKGAPKEQLERAIESGWKGAERGLEKSMLKAVREGVEEGINRMRKTSLRFDLGDYSRDSPVATLSPGSEYENSKLEVKAPDEATVKKPMVEEAQARVPTQERLVQRGDRTIRQTVELRGMDVEVVNEADLGEISLKFVEQLEKTVEPEVKKNKAA
jgi:hypothetical protein